jgi:hypothetical protein
MDAMIVAMQDEATEQNIQNVMSAARRSSGEH